MHKGRKRREPVWIGRYRIVGKDSAKVLGKAWTKRSCAPEGYLTRADAEAALRQMVVRESAGVTASSGAESGQVADRYLSSLEARIRTGSFRASTLRTYRNIIERELRPMWGSRPVAGITSASVGAYHLQRTTTAAKTRSCGGEDRERRRALGPSPCIAPDTRNVGRHARGGSASGTIGPIRDRR